MNDPQDPLLTVWNIPTSCANGTKTWDLNPIFAGVVGRNQILHRAISSAWTKPWESGLAFASLDPPKECLHATVYPPQSVTLKSAGDRSQEFHPASPRSQKRLLDVVGDVLFSSLVSLDSHL
jgi:hypothetical protein